MSTGPTGRRSASARTPTWFDVPPVTRDKLNVYIGESTFHKERPHGAWNTEDNKKMVKGVNKDWPGRPGYEDAYMTAYFATRQWLQSLREVIADDTLWTRMRNYGNRKGSALDHDLKYALKIGMMTGHWQGQGEPCDPSFSLNICGSRNGLGGDLIGARNAIRDYFDRSRDVLPGALPVADPALRAGAAERRRLPGLLEPVPPGRDEVRAREGDVDEGRRAAPRARRSDAGGPRRHVRARDDRRPGLPVRRDQRA